MNEAQEATLKRIQDYWLNVGCPWEVEENGDTVYIYPLSTPALSPNGTAMKIDQTGESEWVRRYPEKSKDPQPKPHTVCEVEGCNEKARFFPHSDKLKRKVGLCEIHFKHALNLGYVRRKTPLLCPNECGVNLEIYPVWDNGILKTLNYCPKCEGFWPSLK